SQGPFGRNRPQTRCDDGSTCQSHAHSDVMGPDAQRHLRIRALRTRIMVRGNRFTALYDSANRPLGPEVPQSNTSNLVSTSKWRPCVRPILRFLHDSWGNKERGPKFGVPPSTATLTLPLRRS